MLVHKINGAYLMYTEGTVNFFYQYFMGEFVQMGRDGRVNILLAEQAEQL